MSDYKTVITYNGQISRVKVIKDDVRINEAKVSTVEQVPMLIIIDEFYAIERVWEEDLIRHKENGIHKRIEQKLYRMLMEKTFERIESLPKPKHNYIIEYPEIVETRTDVTSMPEVEFRATAYLYRMEWVILGTSADGQHMEMVTSHNEDKSIFKDITTSLRRLVHRMQFRLWNNRKR
jgi:hypothetical protein